MKKLFLICLVLFPILAFGQMEMKVSPETQLLIDKVYQKLDSISNSQKPKISEGQEVYFFNKGIFILTGEQLFEGIPPQKAFVGAYEIKPGIKESFISFKVDKACKLRINLNEGELSLDKVKKFIAYIY